MDKWSHIPVEQGWYWHRFYIDDCPIYNVCCVAIADGNMYIQHLGEAEQEVFHVNYRESYWGPLTPPQ